MRTLNYVVLVLVLASFGFVSFGCGDDSSSPVSPSSTPMAEAPSYAPMGSPAVRSASYSPDADTVDPGDARYGPNAYDFYAHMDSGMLHVALVEDAMQTMRNASQPHRMRQVDVYHVTSEPRHVLQTHGDPIYSGTVRLSGRLELPPIAIDGCAAHEWIIVQAAELSDDRYDGWRNAPCPQPDGVVVGSDGSGPGWERSEHGPPARNFPILNQPPVITHPGNKRYQRGDTIDSFRIVATDPDDGDTATVTAVTGLPDGLTWSGGMVSGTVAMDAAERSYPVTITATDGTAEVSRSFTITIGTATILNQPPTITHPGNKRYQRGDTIDSFRIVATDPDDGDTATVTAVTGLPDGLTWSGGMVSGTVAMDAAERSYPVTITATDGTAEVSRSFTITIGTATILNQPPTITHPGNKRYQRGDTIDSFRIVATDPDDGDTATVTAVTGLPDGLTWSGGMVSGTVAMDAAERSYPVTITATDGTAEVSRSFTITIGTATILNQPPTITHPGNKRYQRGDTIDSFRIVATDPDDGDTATVTAVTGLPDGLTWSGGMVSGTVAMDAAERSYPVTITATDGAAEVSRSFTITIGTATILNQRPTITHPGDWNFYIGYEIDPFPIVVTDADDDDVTVFVAGLPDDLTYSRGMVSGSVADGQATGPYRVTVNATDGTDDAEPVSFVTEIEYLPINPTGDSDRLPQPRGNPDPEPTEPTEPGSAPAPAPGEGVFPEYPSWFKTQNYLEIVYNEFENENFEYDQRGRRVPDDWPSDRDRLPDTGLSDIPHSH